MLNPEKKEQANAFRLALANFFEEVAGTSTLTDLHNDYLLVFEAAMLSEYADDSEFRDRAVLILQLTKSFEKHFAAIPWETISKESTKMKKKVERKILGV